MAWSETLSQKTSHLVQRVDVCSAAERLGFFPKSAYGSRNFAQESNSETEIGNGEQSACPRVTSNVPTCPQWPCHADSRQVSDLPSRTKYIGSATRKQRS